MSFFTIKPRAFCRFEMPRQLKKTEYGQAIRREVNTAFKHISQEHAERRYFIAKINDAGDEVNCLIIGDNLMCNRDSFYIFKDAKRNPVIDDTRIRDYNPTPEKQNLSETLQAIYRRMTRHKNEELDESLLNYI